MVLEEYTNENGEPTKHISEKEKMKVSEGEYTDTT